MRLVLRPTLVQSSSTTLRWVIEFKGEVGLEHRVFLERLSETTGFTLYVNDEEHEIYVHDESPRPAYSSLAILYILRNLEVGKMYASEGNPVCLDVGAEDIDYGRPERVHLVIADPAVGCHVQCPWCYVRPRPLDTSIIPPGMYTVTEKWELVHDRLVENVVNTVKSIVKGSEERLPHVTVVVGGSMDPTSLPERYLLSLYLDIHEKLEKEGLNNWVYYAVTTSNPVEFILRHEPLRDTLRDLCYWSEIVVTMLPPHLARRHPMFSRNLENYYDALLKLAGEDVTIAYILTEEDPIAKGHYDSLNLRILNVLEAARKVFLLSYHPIPGIPYTPPSRQTIISFLEELVIGLGKTMDRIEMDACTGIRLGFPADAINKAEAAAMHHCTPDGCRRAKICPRGAPKCIARH